MIINVKVNGFEILYTPNREFFITTENYMISFDMLVNDFNIGYDNLKTELYNLGSEEHLKNVVYRIQDNFVLFADTEEFNVVFEIIRDLKEFIVFLEEE